MKRRLNILCLIVMLVLSYSVLEAGYYFFISVKMAVESVGDNVPSHLSHEKILKMKIVRLMPDAFTLKGGEIFPDSVYNEKSKTYVPACYASMAVSIDTHPATWKTVVSRLLNLLQIGVYIWAVVLFFRLIVAINKSEIFNWLNMRRLRRLGFALIVGFCCAFIIGYIDYQSISEVFSLKGYDLSFSKIVDITMLVLGLSSLIVGEVFAIGLKMKEEQDLTI